MDLHHTLAENEATLVEARHPRWSGRLRLRPALKRVVLTTNGTGGSFELEGDMLAITWDLGGTETFRRVGTCFMHCDLPALPECEEAVGVDRRPASPLRAAIVTAYFKEPRALLDRCIDSVRQQTIPADHILVADGYPQDWIDAAGLRHIRLDRSHGDYGNTPRGIGALLAVAEGYDAIGFLDADNWLEPDHVACGAAAAQGADGRCDFVIARMHLRRPDETILPIEGQAVEEHVDTNCFLFFPGAFHTIMTFATMPRQLSGLGDRVFYAYLRDQKLKSAVIPTKTVNYHCIWESFYRAAGEQPPPDAKPNIDSGPMEQWIRELSPLHRTYLTRRTGLAFR